MVGELRNKKQANMSHEGEVQGKSWKKKCVSKREHLGVLVYTNCVCRVFFTFYFERGDNKKLWKLKEDISASGFPSSPERDKWQEQALLTHRTTLPSLSHG